MIGCRGGRSLGALLLLTGGFVLLMVVAYGSGGCARAAQDETQAQSDTPVQPDEAAQPTPQYPEEEHYRELRERMVETQLAKPLDGRRPVEDKRVLGAMRKVLRHKFVPERVRHDAYQDYPLQIGEDQTISQPYMVGLMTELLEPKKEDVVLEIGTGSGYQAAILGELCKEVYSIEIIDALTQRAIKALKELKYKNVHAKTGDGWLGWPEHALFDAIVVTCAAPNVPPPLIEQLKEGGRLVIPVSTEPYGAWENLMRYRKVNGELQSESILPCAFVPMTGGLGKEDE